MKSKILSIEPQKKEDWTQPFYVKTIRDLISRMDDKRSNFLLVIKANSGLNG